MVGCHVQRCSFDARNRVSRHRNSLSYRWVGTMARGARSVLPSPSAGMSRWWPAPPAGARHPAQGHNGDSTPLLHVTARSGSMIGNSHPRQGKVRPVISPPGAGVLGCIIPASSRALEIHIRIDLTICLYCTMHRVHCLCTLLPYWGKGASHSRHHTLQRLKQTI